MLSTCVKAHGDASAAHASTVCSWNSAPKCDLAKLRDQNIRNIIELIQNNLLRSLGASAQMTVAAAAGSGKQSKGAKGSSSAAAAPASTAKSKASAAPAAKPSQGRGPQKDKKPPLPPPVDPPLEVDSSEDEVAEEEEEEEPKVHDMVVDPEHDVSKERERSVSASTTTRLPPSNWSPLGAPSQSQTHQQSGGQTGHSSQEVAWIQSSSKQQT